MKVVEAFDAAGVEMIGESSPSQGTGRGVRFKVRAVQKAAAPVEAPGHSRKA
jgi:hypothetical protein